MPFTVTIFSEPDIVSAVERAGAENNPVFLIKHKANSYYNCFELSIKENIDILILQVKSPIARAQDLMYDLQCANFTPVLLLFELQDANTLLYTISDQSENDLAGAVADFFEKALAGIIRCDRASFRTTVWDDNIQSFAEKVGRSESLKEILRGCSEDEFLVHRERYGLNLQERGYYLYFWELMDMEYSNHRQYKDILNFIGAILQRECTEVLMDYCGGEVFYLTLNLLCIIINDPHAEGEITRVDRFDEMIGRLAVFTGCKTAHRYLSGRIENVKGLRAAYDKHHLQKPSSFFLRGDSVMRPSHLEAKKAADMETVDQLLHEITHYLHYDILNPALSETLHRLYFDILKPSMSYTLFYSCIASVYSAMAESLDFYDDPLPFDSTGPGLLQYSSIEEQYEITLAQIAKCRARSANKRQKNSLVLKVVDYISAHYSEDIAVTDIASALFINNNYLSQVFKKNMGTSVIKYLINFRIDQAKKLLAETDNPVFIVAEEVGFHEFRHFSKTFKRITGLSPAQYRKKGR